MLPGSRKRLEGFNFGNLYCTTYRRFGINKVRCVLYDRSNRIPLDPVLYDCILQGSKMRTFLRICMVLGDAVSKLETFVWISNHVSRSTTKQHQTWSND